MARKISAGILLYRLQGGVVEVFLVHPGGPYWRNKDAGAWSIPKGEVEADDDALATARREFEEETGSPVGGGEFVSLASLAQPGGKLIHAWAVEGEIDASSIRSNLFSMEWPPRSGREQQFPEVDRGAWFTLEEAAARIVSGQRGFLDRLQRTLASPEGLRRR